MKRYIYVWSYRVRPGSQAEFLKHYHADGTWVQLFRKGTGHIGTQLYQDRDDPFRYLTVDTWTSREAFDEFGKTFAADFDALDTACEQLTEEEVALGKFSPVETL